MQLEELGEKKKGGLVKIKKKKWNLIH
jgi:hypothetical protein